MPNALEQVLQLGVEAEYGTDPVLDATKAMRAYNITPVPFAGQTKDRTRAGVGNGAYPVAHLGTYQTFTFDFDLSGGGAAGTEPLWGPIAEICNMAKTIVPATSVTYVPQVYTDTACASATLYFNWGGIKHKLTGARGELGLIFQTGDIAMGRAVLTGLFNAAADAAFPDVEATIASWIDGVEFNKDNTTFSLHGATPALDSAQINLGNPVKFTPRPNAQAVRLAGRRQSGANIVFEMATVAGKDWLGIAKANTLGALQLVHGKTAGNIVQIDAGKVQLVTPTISDKDGDQYVSSNTRICRNPGGVEFKITVK